eukprot:366009-Chlamydomonas_euryale.AAC.25
MGRTGEGGALAAVALRAQAHVPMSVHLVCTVFAHHSFSDDNSAMGGVPRAAQDAACLPILSDIKFLTVRQDSMAIKCSVATTNQ